MVPEKENRKSKSLTRTGEKPARKKTETAIAPMSQEQRHGMIRQTAYYIAEKDGFNGDDVKYWLAAEQEINKKYS